MKSVRVGVDLVSIHRMRVFLKSHTKRRVFRLLSSQERKKFSRRKLSPRMFAKMYAAKEAFFKTLNQPWMGLEGFSAMHTQILPRNRFTIRLAAGHWGIIPDCESEGVFFSAGDLLGAQVIRWEFL